jgi:hypothetical protein
MPAVAAAPPVPREEEPPGLRDIVAQPEKYQGRQVIPRGLYRLGRLVSDDKAGTCNVRVLQSGLRVESQRLVAVAIDEGEATALEMEPSLADKLLAHRPWHRERGVDRAEDSWEKHVAILTIGVSRDQRWLYRIRKIEFLLNVDCRRIGQSQLASACQTYWIGTDGEGLGRGNPFDWQKRFGTRFILDTKGLAQNLVAREGNPPAQSPQPLPDRGTIFDQDVRLDYILP